MNAEISAEAARDDSARATAALLAGILLIGVGPMLVKYASSSVNSEVIAFYRLFVAAIALTPMAISRFRKGAGLTRGNLPTALLAGFFFGVNITMWNFALTMTTASNVTLLDNTAPVWVGLLTWLLFRRKLPRTYWLGLALALGGALMILRGSGTVNAVNTAPGDLLALFAGMVYALYLLTAEFARRSIDNLIFVWIFSGTGALLMLVFALLRGSPLIGFPLTASIAILALSLIVHLGGWLAITYALGTMPASTVSVILLGQPVVATLLAIPLYREIPPLASLLGGIITLTGIIIVLRGERNNGTTES